MSMLGEYYGEIDLKQIYFNTKNKKYVSNFEEIMELLTIIIIDQAAFINSVACSGIFNNRAVVENKYPWLLKHLDNILVNAFHIPKVKDIRSLKEVLFDKILNYEINIDHYLDRVAEIHSQSHQYKSSPLKTHSLSIS
jgi:hypothetical protein